MRPTAITSSVLKKGPWTPEEDIRLKNDIQKFGEGKWHLVPLRAGINRCRKSCRLRWLNYLKPNIKRGAFQEDEVDLMHRLHRLLGNRWSLIAGRIPGRTANDIKNYWNTHVQSRSKRQNVESKECGPSQHKVVQVIKPKAYTISKTFNMCPEIALHDKGKETKLSNDGFNISPPLVPPPAVSNDQILDKLFEDYENEMYDEEIGWSLPADVNVEGVGLDVVRQEDDGDSLFNFPIDDVLWNLLD